ncbi:uncharacterized protein LOC101846889 [Aplysia californica]|uniref:Uncharacterized protein LOC101846889 n=1 Tax=Aplysia californica TaxID=6500 RepID=A0ABM0JTK0_APLCA|nr:uncharacterized protein LOC101846889 [Aplysia californica]
MKNLTELQNSYLTSLKAITTSSSNRKLAQQKKDDEKNHWKANYSFEKEKEAARKQFPLTSNMVVMSLLFWIVISALVYLVVSYSILYARIKQESDLDGPCRQIFSTLKEENLKILENYTYGDASAYLARLKPPSSVEDFPMESNTLPPLVTGVTSDQFYQLQGLIHHLAEDIKPTHSDVQLIVYDLGLYQKERELLKKYGHCEVRDFDYESFPRHVSFRETYAWRPIVLQNVLLEHGSAMYVEPTTRFKNPSSPNYLRMRGSRSYFVWDHVLFTSLVAYSDRDMFTFVNENRCTFKECSLLSPEAIVLYRTETTWNELMKPWLKCALNEDCISPQHARYSGCFDIRRPRTTGCHRYDMSALTMVLNRASQYTIGTERMVSFRLTYTDDTEVSLFPEQPWSYKQIVFLVLAPVLLVLIYKFGYKKRRGYRFF